MNAASRRAYEHALNSLYRSVLDSSQLAVFNEQMAIATTSHMSGVLLLDSNNGHVDTVTGGINSPVAGAYGADEVGMLKELMPHWLNAYALHRQVSKLKQELSALQDAVDRLPDAMILLDDHRKILHANLAAERLLSSGLHLRHRNGELSCSDRELQMALIAATKASDSLTGSGTRQFLLRNQDGRPSFVAKVNAIPPCADFRIGSEVRCVLTIRPTVASSQVDVCANLRQLFGLTFAEAELCKALYETADLGESARRCGITPGAAQTRLKIVFDKTGVRSQVALTRLLAAIVGL